MSNNDNVQETSLKDIVNEHVSNEIADDIQDSQEITEARNDEPSDELKKLISKDMVLMEAKKKTRGAEIMGIFARHNFYANGLTPIELRTTLEDLGSTYVKIGQIMSSRTDLFPESYCAELVKLRQTVQPLPSDVARAVVEQETGKKIEELFSEFRDEPLGSASIGQVHYGVLKDGRKVVVKVQRPLIGDMMEKDFELLKKLGGIVNVVSDTDDGSNLIDLVSVIEELEKVTMDELDFRVEADHTREFRGKCIDDPEQISCPEILDDMSTDKLLTMTFVDGYSISNKQRLIDEGFDPEDVGARIVNNYVHQVLDVGMFHADPHQGNIMFSEGKPYWIDFGMIGTISEANINLISQIVLGVLQSDAEALSSAAISMGTASSKTDRNKLMRDIDAFLEKYMNGTSIADINVDEVFSGFSDLASSNYITLPGEFTMLLRSIIMVEGVIEELCPSLNLFELLSSKFMDRAKKSFDVKQSLLQPTTQSGMPLLSAVGFLFSISLGIYAIKQMTHK